MMAAGSRVLVWVPTEVGCLSIPAGYAVRRPRGSTGATGGGKLHSRMPGISLGSHSVVGGRYMSSSARQFYCMSANDLRERARFSTFDDQDV